MHPPSLKTAVRRIRSLAGPPDGITDSDLLARYRATRDERAFAALVARHGPAVLGTCRRIVADPHASEDAFQATFLVLARRAGAVRQPAALGCWLHGVAVRVSMKLKGRLARQPRSVPIVEVPADPRDEVLWRDVRRVLDEEVNRLPERLRLPVYLCYFEGKTRDEAADVLGWKVSTLRGRLEDGRSRLRTRLALRGIELSAALLAVSAAADGLAVGDALIESTVRAAGGPASEVVRSLVRGVAASGAAAKATLTAGTIVLALGLGTALLGFRGDPGQAAGPGPGLRPPPADEKPKPSAELIVLMQSADRVWVVDSPTDKQPVPEPVEVLKGMSPPAPGYTFSFKAPALKDLPRAGHRWVVFLKSVDEVDHIPKVAPLAGEKWYVPADDTALAALREYVPPCEWGEPSNGLRLGLYARPKADEPTVEVVLQNVGTKDLTVEQFRGNYFDDWPHLTFAVIGRDVDGKPYRLERRGPPHKDNDAPIVRVLKAGDRYIHVVRLNRWLTAPDRGTAGNAPAGLFAGGGDFQVDATYQITDGRDPPRWWIGKLTSKPVTASIPAPGAYGDVAGDFRVRLRPVGKLKVGESPELILDAKYTGKEKWTIDRRPENAEVEWDGKWFTAPVRLLFGGHALTEMAPGAEFLPWETVRPDGEWLHLRDKPDAAGDPGEAIKELIPFRLTPGSHTVRVAYWFGKDARAVSNAITVEVPPDGWGDPAGGVRSRLRLGKTKFKPGDVLEFTLDLKNVGRKTWELIPIPFGCEVFVDDERYAYYGELDYKAAKKELKPGGQLVPFLSGTVDNKWQARRAPIEGPVDETERPPPRYVPFRLAPGKHKVRVAFPLPDTKLLSVSNTVEIEVESPRIDSATRAMALRADRIWVVPSPTREMPVPSPVAVLKGPPADATHGGLFDLRLLPGDDPTAKWIVFLLADEDKPVPEVKVWQWAQWSRPYTPELAEAIRQAILPAEWGPEKDGLRLGLRLRESNPKAGEPVAAEVTIRNVGTKPRELQQLRYNIYDYWPQLRFEVTAPDNSKWVLEKPDGAISEADAPTRITLKPGETYTHTMRLDRWPAHPTVPKEGTYPPNVFTKPGEYTVTCRYSLTFPLNETTWTAGLESTAVKLTVRDPAKEPAWGDAVNGLRARARLAKTKLGPDEPLSFSLDLKNERFDVCRVEAEEHRCWFILDGYKLPLDGLRYFYAGPPGLSKVSKDLPPQAEERGFLTVTPDERWMRKNPGLFEFPYRRPVGKHILVVEYQADEKTRVRTPAVEFEAADDFGDPVGGAAVRLRMKKTFKAGETPAFELDLKNNADKTYVFPINAERCELQLDGVTYTRADRLGAAASNTSMYLGTEFVPFLKADLGGNWTVPTHTGDPGPLPLSPGKHRLKVAYPVAKDVHPVTREVEFEVVGDDWGQPAGGVSARLRLAKGTFKAGESFAFELDLKNTGEQTYDVGPVPQHCRIELDGLLTYTYIGPINLDTPLRRIAPGEERAPWVQVTTDRNWAHAGWLYVPFKLAPGKHTVRVSYPLTDKVTPVSQPVEFTVTADEWGEASGGIRAHVRLTKATFKAGEPLAFELDLKNTGDQTVEDGPIPMLCLINLDGAEYRYTAPLGYPTSIQKLTPGKEFVPWVKVETNQWWTHVRGEQAVPLALTPGKHTLKVTYPLPGERKPTSPAIKFEVTDGDAKPPDLAALAAAADRIVVADIEFVGGVPGITPKRTLKGPNNRWRPDQQLIKVPAGADLLPGEVPDDPIPGQKRSAGTWTLFLKAEEEGSGAPKLSPVVPHGWYRPASDKEIEAVTAALPKPAEAGKAVNGLTLSLRPKTQIVRAGEEVRLEVVLTNTTKETLRVLQQRYNVYDYWPFLTFQITLPNGQKLTVAKPEGEFTREDFVDEATLKAGESYTHAVRLERWPGVEEKMSEDLGLPPFAFAVPGTYKVLATYKAPIGFKNLRPDVKFRDWPFWNGELTSNTVTVEVKSPFDEFHLLSKPGAVPLLYLVLTHPKADHGVLDGLVVKYAAAALAEADRVKFATGNVVFLVRERAGDDRGYTTGFSREQLETIRKAKPDEARRLAGEHAWTLGRLPDGK